MNDDRPTNVNARATAMQIIAGALVFGVAVFAGITIFLGALDQPQQPGLVKYIGVGLLVFELVPFFLVPSFITPDSIRKSLQSQGQSVPDDETGLLLMVYQTRMIIRFALLEGAAFLNLIAFLIEHARWSLGVAVGLAVWMLAMFPTRTRIEHWLEAQQMTGVNDQ